MIHLIKQSQILKNFLNKPIINYQFARAINRRPKVGKGDSVQDEQSTKTLGQISQIKRRQIDEQESIEPKHISQMIKEEAHEEKQQNQKAAQMEKRIEEQFYNDDFDLELENIIASKIEQGKSNQQIMDELMGGKSGREVKKFQTNEKYEKNLDIMVDSQTIPGQQGSVFDRKNNPFITSSMTQELDAIEQYKEILKDEHLENKVGSIPEQPIWQYQQSNKLTDLEKDEMQMNLTALKENMTVPGMTQESFKDIDDPFKIEAQQEGDKNRLTKLEQRELLQKISEQGVEQYSNIIGQNDRPKSALDLKLEYLQNSNQIENKEFKDLVLSDRDDAFEYNLVSTKQEMFEDRAIDKQLQPDSFSRQKTQLTRITKKYGLQNYNKEDIEEVIDKDNQIEIFEELQKEALFAKKKLQEDNDKYQQYLKKKEKIKEFRQYEKQLNENQLKDNIDYNKETEKIPNKILKNKELDMIDTDHIDKLNKMEENVKYDTTRFDFHQIRTENNVREYIEDYFAKDDSVINSLFCHQNVYIQDVFMNSGLTVVYVFWNYSVLPSTGVKLDKKSKPDPKQQEIQQKLEKDVQKKLTKHSKFLSGKLCSDLGFKYGPEVRFHKSIVDERENQAEDEVRKTMPDIVKKVLVEDMGIKKISAKQLKEITQRYEDRAMDQLRETLGNQMYLKEVKGKKPKYQFDENGKRIRNNRTADGKRKKYIRPNKADKFWDNLNA